MAGEILDEKAIFNVARKIDSEEARAEYLHQVCGADGNLFERVDTLLRAYEEQASFLESPAADSFSPTIDQPPLEEPGTQIGPYKLLQQIGEGGMGVVYMAEQSEPVERRVALKIIKPGMDTRQVIARFEAERQALAMMDHPHIAKVLDAGATDSGRPYFVMELVKGVPITQYCDERHLTPKQRLELFLSVLLAVQHAHQKGIIHRDIKPTNVLVAEYDDRPVPKVIDFGVAKATSQKLTEKTMFTEYGQLVGTLDYMSPEQAKLNQMDIDTRSDIYSLGVLLYELLTGDTPFDRTRLRSAAFEEMMRIIREEEPPKPSTRLSTSQMLASVSANRNTEPRKLSTLVKGDLDWIVMKALDKDRGRRYETANGFAADLQRYLDNEPVEACPPSATYRLTKFARRNRGVLLTTAVIALALVLGTAVSTWQAIRAIHAESQARDNETRAIGEERKANAERERAAASEKQAEADFQKALEAVDRMLFRVADDALRNVPQMVPVQEKVFRDAVEFYEKLLADRPRDPKLRFATAMACKNLIGHDKVGKPQKMLQRALEILNELHEESPEDSEVRHALAHCYNWLGWKGGDSLISAENCHRRAIELMLPLKDSRPEDLARSYGSLAVNLKAQRRFDEAEQTFRMALEFGSDDGQVYHGLALLLERVGRVSEAIDAMNRAIDAAQNSIHDSSKWRTNAEERLASDHSHLGSMLIRAQRPEESLPHLLKSQQIYERLARDFPSLDRFSGALDRSRAALVGAYHTLKKDEAARQILVQLQPSTAQEYLTRGNLRKTLGEMPEALADYDKAIELDPANAKAYLQRQLLHQELGQFDQAVIDLTHRRALMPERSDIHNSLGVALDKKGDLDEAIACYEKAIELDPNYALAHSNLGAAWAKKGLHDKAIACDKKAIELSEQLVADFPENSSYQGSLKKCHDSFAVNVRRVDPIERAEQVRLDALAFYEALAKQFPKRSAAHRAREAAMRESLAELLKTTNRPQEVEEHYRRAQAIWQQLVVELPEKPEYAVRLAVGDTRLGKWLAAQSHFKAAEAAYRQAVQGYEKLAREFPKSSGYQINLADCHTDLGDFLARSARLGEAEQSHRQAVTLLEKLVVDDPGNSAYRARLAHKQNWLSGALKALGRDTEAEEAIRQALWTFENLAAEFPEVADYRYNLAWEHLYLSNQMLAASRTAEAERENAQALDLFAAVAAEAPTNAKYRAALASTHHRLAMQFLAGQRFEEAANAYGQAVDLSRQLVADFPTKSEYPKSLALNCNNLAWLLGTCPEAGVRDAVRAVELAAKAVELEPKQAMYWNTLGAAEYHAGNYRDSIKAFEKSTQLSADQPENARNTSFDAFFLAMAHWQLGEKDEARKWYDQAVAWMEKNRPKDAELLRFHQEAAELLGIGDTNPETKK